MKFTLAALNGNRAQETVFVFQIRFDTDWAREITETVTAPCSRIYAFFID